MSQSVPLEQPAIPQAPKSKPLKLPSLLDPAIELDINPEVALMLASPCGKTPKRGGSLTKNSVLKFLSSKGHLGRRSKE